MKKLLLSSVFTFFLALGGGASASEILVLGDDGGCCGSSIPSNVHNFYNGLAGHTSTLGSSVVTAAALSGIELLWAVQPSNAYTPTEILAMSAYLSTGGRIAFMGEHGGSGFAVPENNLINATLAALGSAMSIQNANVQDGGSQIALRANGEILTHDLTAGVDAYHYAAFAPILGAPEILMYGHNLTSVMMGFENIGAGSIFLITDQNVFDSGRLNAGDNRRMFENLLLADTGAPPPPPQCGQPGQPPCPTPIPIPSTIPLIGFGLALLGFRRIRK